MNRKILYIIGAAILTLLLFVFLWWWLLARQPASISTHTGTFGTAQNASSTPRGSLGSGGSASTIGSATGAGSASGQGGVGTVGAGGAVGVRQVGGTGAGGTGSGGIAPDYNYPVQPVIDPVLPWLGGGGSASASERPFSGSELAQLNSGGYFGGSPNIAAEITPPGAGTSLGILGATAVGCAAVFAAGQLGGLLGGGATAAGTAALGGGFVLTYDFQAYTQRSQNQYKDVLDCITRTIAKAAINQITSSVVSWINSGFNGKPAFVQNYNQFFANVADEAAGRFIKGSGLSFLCSPFAPQIKIAIAQSYARRGSAPSCTLTSAINNVNSFLSGNWGAGGWGGLLQFTTVPTNNPFGAYAYAEAGLNSTIQNAQTNANRNISPGGFLSVQKCEEPQGPSLDGKPLQKVCRVTTPGTVVEETLNTTLGGSLRNLELAKNFDEIISALITQLMTKTLYSGLGSLGQIQNPLAPGVNTGATQEAQALLTSLQQAVSLAGQYGGVIQGSASDVLRAQARLNDLFNCWDAASSSEALTAAQRAQAAVKAHEADIAIAALQPRIAAYNNEILRVNSIIARIQELQTMVLTASTAAEVQQARLAYNAAAGGGITVESDGKQTNSQTSQTSAFITQAEVQTAIQNRAALQEELSNRNAQTQNGLEQCNELLK